MKLLLPSPVLTSLNLPNIFDFFRSFLCKSEPRRYSFKEKTTEDEMGGEEEREVKRGEEKERRGEV